MNASTTLSALILAGSVTWAAAQENQPIPGIGPAGEIVRAHTGFTFTEGPAADAEGNVFFTDVRQNRIHRVDTEGRLSTFLENSQACNGLMFAGSGKLIACQGGAGRVIAIDIKTKEQTVLAEVFEGKPFNAPNDLVIDRSGGIYFTDPQFGQQPNHQGTYAVYYIDRKGRVTQLLRDQPKPNGILLAPDEKTLYVLPSTADHLLAWPVFQPGQLGLGGNWRPLARDAEGKSGGGDGLTVDTKGNLYLTLPSLKAVQVMSARGETLGLIHFPEPPANCAFGGRDLKTLYVTARSSLYTVRMEATGHRFAAKGR
jgi:gluconolactonase